MTIVARGSAILVVALALAVWTIPGTAAGEQRVGVNAAVNPDASGTPPGAPTRQLMIGQQVVYHEHIVTTGAGQTQILFLDESTMTIAPDSDLTIDEFVYNPDTGKGQLAMSAARGVMRFVGGKLSKNENAVTMTTPTGTLGIRGGVFAMDLAADGHLAVIFLYGKGLTVTENCAAATGTQCPSQTITRPGFAVTIAGRGAAPSTPAPAPPGALGKLLASLGGRTGSTAGAPAAPSDATVAQSGIGSAVSGNFTANVQAANQNQPPSAQPQPVNVSAIQSTQQVNTIQSQPQINNNTTSGVVVYPLGLWLDAGNDGSVTVTPPISSRFASLANGRLTVFSQGAPFPHNGGSIPLPPGLANFGPPDAVNDSGHPLVGATYLSPDQSLFFGYGNEVGKGLDVPGGDTTFLLGGVPTVTLPTMGTGSYSGPAFGGVFNNGASYVATGSFAANYNFASLSGSMTISNLDGKTFGGSIFGTPSGPYVVSLTGSGLVGAAEGLFFGPMASTTGGLFAVVSSLNPNSYHILGVFGGPRH